MQLVKELANPIELEYLIYVMLLHQTIKCQIELSVLHDSPLASYTTTASTHKAAAEPLEKPYYPE